MAALDEAARLRLVRWADVVTDDIAGRLHSLPEELRYAGLASLVLALMGEMIWRSGDPEREAEHLKNTVDAAMAMLPEIEKTIAEKMEAVRQGAAREPGHG